MVLSGAAYIEYNAITYAQYQEMLKMFYTSTKHFVDIKDTNTMACRHGSKLKRK